MPDRRGRRPGRRAPDPARRAAFDALRAVHAADAYANLTLPPLLTRRGIVGRDAAFATELLAGTCRLEGSYDEIIEAASQRRRGSLQPAVLDLLRLGTHQLLGMRVPVHAAVAATVDLAAATVGERVTGLVNAVLRKVAGRTWPEWIELLAAGRDVVDALALGTAHPAWIVRAYADLLPADELEPALLADNVSASVSLVVRPGLASVDELVAAGAERGRWSPYAASWSGNPADLGAIRDGTAGVQDEGSQLATWGLGRAPSSAQLGWWLDLCAGPGGKSALLAGMAAEQTARLLATEVAPHRARLVSQALRSYPDLPPVVVADGTRPAWRARAFDRVLVDVPCTGLGALRRRPESRWRRSAGDVEQLHLLQKALLGSALDAAAPGGVVAYVTCSPHRRETADVVDEVLAGRPDVVVAPAAEVLPELPADAFTGPYLQLWPHRHGTDAMFAAYLRRRG
ncbi:MAG TPA: RsmB/NOP family class I SAM-dependent RNA methyltransferase [Microlunatus sp.]|nr:RsmB/NOP family class I SAM-dependent RNA methyltransferase [Microlunatus sp.]